ncbi:MAG: hypothetical protein ABI035_14560 [Gemmatimonadaceae bacterium]
MRYRSLIGSTAILLGIAACKGSSNQMNADLAKDLDAARTSDALALAPHSGVQTVVSAAELSPEARTRVQSSARSTRTVARRTPHKDRITPAVSEASAEIPAPAPVEVASTAPSPSVTPSDASATSSPPSPRPQPVDVPASGSARGSDRGGGSSIGGIIGAIGGAILRGGVVDGDHCDPRGRHGGGILINQRGPIFRGNY